MGQQGRPHQSGEPDLLALQSPGRETCRGSSHTDSHMRATAGETAASVPEHSSAEAHTVTCSAGHALPCVHMCHTAGETAVPAAAWGHTGHDDVSGGPALPCHLWLLSLLSLAVSTGRPETTGTPTVRARAHTRTAGHQETTTRRRLWAMGDRHHYKGHVVQGPSGSARFFRCLCLLVFSGSGAGDEQISWTVPCICARA